jgi:hypothetical protein
MKNRVIVALNMSMFSASGKLNKARTLVSNIAANSATFTNPNPSLAVLNTAMNNLDTAIIEAEDGSRTKTALRQDYEDELMKQLHILAAYVGEVANGDVQVIHLAGMEEKKKPASISSDFKVEQGDHTGSVKIKIKAAKQKKTIYKWEHSSDTATWISDGITGVCKTTIDGLAKGIYWFRVILIDASGEHEQARLSFAVN